MGGFEESLDLDDLEIPPEWTPVRELPEMSPHTRFLSSVERVTTRYYTTGEAQTIAGVIRLGKGTEGPPGHAHGGSMASILDEAMGFACWLHGMPVLAARIEVDFRAPLPIPTLVKVMGRITDVDGRKISAVGALRGLDGTLYSESTGLFVRLSPEMLAKLA